MYGTISEGYRSGFLNRPGGRSTADGSYTVPYGFETDEMTNAEIGWKTDLMDGRMRLNGSVFFAEIDGLQTTIFDPSIANLFFSDNAANAEVSGIEADMIYVPAAVDGLTISASMSMLDSEITDTLTPSGDVVKGDSLHASYGTFRRILFGHYQNKPRSYRQLDYARSNSRCHY